MNLTLAFLLFTGSPPRSHNDPWLGRDKFVHFTASALIQGAAYSLFHRGARYTVAIQRASLVTVAAGVSKELYDWRHPARNQASWRDLAWDGLGGVTASVAAKQVDR